MMAVIHYVLQLNTILMMNVGFNLILEIDILDPNLLSFELYKRNSGEGDVNSDDNWRAIYDDSWATPKLLQDFRLVISDVPTCT